jgi:hypothetical protein
MFGIQMWDVNLPLFPSRAGKFFQIMPKASWFWKGILKLETRLEK